MSAELIYISQGPIAEAAIADARKRHEAAQAAREDWLSRFNATHPSPSGPRRFATFRDGGIACVEALSSEPVPTGYKFINDERVPGWAPKLSTKAGKAIKAQWDDMKSNPLTEATDALGMPTSLFAGDSLHRCGIAMKDDAQLVVQWGSRDCASGIVQQFERRGGADNWQEWKRSEYYAWIEARGELVSS